MIRALGILLVVVMALGSVSASAQTTLAQQRGDGFVRELMNAAGSKNRDTVEGFLRENMDANYAFNVAFEPVTGIVSPAEQQRLADLMIKFTAYQVLLLAEYAQNGEMRIVGSEQVPEGTRINAMYRDFAGDYPFFVVVGRDLVNGRLLIKDMGSPQVNSVVTNLRYATQSLALGTTDASIWIDSFEKSLQ